MSKKVCVIHTGGTIGMLDTKFGYKPKKGFIKKVLTEIKKLNLSDMPDFDVLVITIIRSQLEHMEDIALEIYT